MKVADYLDKMMNSKMSRSKGTRLDDDTPRNFLGEDEDEEKETKLSGPSVERLAKLLKVDSLKLGEMLKDAIEELKDDE